MSHFGGNNPEPPDLSYPGAFDIAYHVCDLVFALDCDAPPLFTLLTKYNKDIYAQSTIAYNMTKEGLGYLSLVW